jgi:hypothetical protein
VVETTFGVLADIDADSDYDLIFAAYYGDDDMAVWLSQNTGTAEEPAFADPDETALGIIKEGRPDVPPHISLVDIDGDGDLDLYYGCGGDEADPYIDAFENTGNATTPEFADPVRNPYGLTYLADYVDYATPAFADLDGDGDLDLLAGISRSVGYLSNLVFFVNERVE